MSKVFKNSAENRFRRMINYSFILSCVTLIFGLLILLVPNATNKVVGIITGILFLLSGLMSIYKYFKRDGARLYSLNLVYGILYSILGIVIIIFPFSVMTFVTVCLGIYLVITGALKLNYSFWIKKGSEESWPIVFATGILLIIIGILVMFNPFVQLTLTKLVGIFLILEAVLDFTSTLLFKQRAKEIRNIFW